MENIKSFEMEDKKIQFLMDATFISQKLIEIVKSELNQHLKEHRISYKHWLIMKVIHFDGVKTPSDIASLTFSDKPTISRATDLLVNYSLLNRTRGRNDRRMVKLEITEQGESVLMSGFNILEKAHKEFKNSLTSNENELFSMIESNLSDQYMYS